MATKKEVTVVINGEEHVSEAADQAGASITLFGKKIPLMIDPVQLATKALGFLKESLDRVWQFTKDSFRAFDEYSASQRKLEASSRLLGIPLNELAAVAKTGREQFELSATTANDLAVATGNLAKKTGESVDKQQLLASVLELGAARGLSAQESLESFERAIMGIDAGFDKLYGKNQSVIFQEYAEKIGTTVGKLSDMQKGQALVWATMEAGEKVQGAYNAYLDDAAGAQARLSLGLEETKTEFGRALQPLRVFALQGLSVVAGLLGGLVVSFARVTNAVGLGLVGAFKLGQSAVGALAVGLGKLTGNKSLETWGRTQAAVFDQFREKLSEMDKKYFGTGEAADESAKTQEEAAQRVGDAATSAAAAVDAATARANKAAAARAAAAEAEAERVNAVLSQQLGEPLARLVGITEGSIRSLAEAASAQLPPDGAALFAHHMTDLSARAREVGERVTTVPPALAAGAKSSQKLASDIATVARGAIDAASSFGVIDAQAQAALGSVVNIAGALGKITGGAIFAGLTGVLGGVASIVSTIVAGDKERRELTRKNTEALERLSRDGVRLSSSASGEQIAGVQSVLNNRELLDVLKTLAGAGSSGRDAGTQVLVKALAAAGLKLSDIDAVASDLGFNLRRSDGSLELSQIPAFLAALNTNVESLTRVGQSWQEQLAFLRQVQAAQGASAADQAQAFLDFVRDRGGARAFAGIDLSDPVAARKQAVDLLVGLNNNVFNAADLGRLTGREFQDAINDFIGLIDAMLGATEDASSAAATADSAGAEVAGPTTPVEDVVVTGADTIPASELAAVITASSDHLASVLTNHTDYHSRIADATEGSWLELQRVNQKLTQVLVSAGLGTGSDEALARQLQTERRLSGDSTL